MKSQSRNTWLAALGLAIAAAAAPAHAATIFQESFDSSLGQFTSSGGVATGTYGARLRGSLSSSRGTITSPAIVTTGYSNLSLSFTRATSGLDSGEAGIASISINGGAFTTLESVQNASGARTITLPANAANQPNVRLQFAINANSTLETYTVDSIVLSGDTAGNPGGGGGTLPPVSSVDADGPLAVTLDKNTGPARAGWVGRPSALGANGLKHPIFIWGPGAGTGPSNYEFFLRRLASHGFLVYSETSTNSGSEMTAAITWLIAENGRAASPYYQKLDTTRIAAGGHSRGSVATFAIGSDSRLTTTIHVAGGSFDGNGSANLRKPTAYICGEADTTATPNCRRDYTATRVPVFFTVMKDVDHISAARSGMPAITAWLRWHLGAEATRRNEFLAPSCTFCTGIWSSQSKNW